MSRFAFKFVTVSLGYAVSLAKGTQKDSSGQVTNENGP